MLETDSVLKAVCHNLCRLSALRGFYNEIRSARICAADKNQNLNQHFEHRPYYEKLIQYEMHTLREHNVHLAKNSTSNDSFSLLVNKIAFIGSGPIPITSMVILNDYAPFADIYNIDMCQEANQLASIISEQVLPSHLYKRMHFITQDIIESPLPRQVKSILNQCQLIYLALFVGDNELTKLSILENIVNRSDRKIIQYFVIRTAKGLRQFMYPKIRAEKIATLQANTNDVNRKFLFQIEEISHSLETLTIDHIIAKSL